MKNLNKVLAMLVVFMMVVSTVAFASFTDVAEDYAHNIAIKVDADLNLFEGYEDGSFKPEGEITRAEFAAIVVRMKGQEEQAEGAKSATQFADVPATHWAAGYINIATRLGIINGYGDGNFGPNDLVEYQDAITMVVRALGYEPAIGAAGYPTGYLTKAGDLKLTDGINGVNGKAINRGTVARIVFNALDVPLMTQTGYGTFTQYVINDGKSATTGEYNVKKTLLSENYGIAMVQGLVKHTTDVTSSSTTITEKVYFEITNHLDNSVGVKTGYMEIGASDVKAYVGQKVVAFIKYEKFENRQTLVSVYPAPVEDSMVIALQDLETKDVANMQANGSKIEYWNANGRLASLKVAGDRLVRTVYVYDEEDEDVVVDSYKVYGPDIYINGIDISKISSSTLNRIYDDLSRMSGTIEFALLDPSNTIADYDTIYIDASIPFVVDKVKTNTATVKSKLLGSDVKDICFNTEDGDIEAVLYGVDGAEMDWRDLEEYDVLMVKYIETDSDKDLYEVSMVDNKVEGKIDGLSGSVGSAVRTITVAGASYAVTPGTEDDEICGELEAGDEGIFYLDENDKVVYFDATLVANRNYGYVVEVAEAMGAFVKGAQVQMLTMDNVLTVFDFAKKVKITVGEVDGRDEPISYTGVQIVKPADADVDDLADLEDDVKLDYRALKDTQYNNGIEGDVITYTANSSNQITALNIAAVDSEVNENRLAKYFTYNTRIDELTNYDPEDGAFKEGVLTEDTVVFYIPADPEDAEIVTLDMLEEDDKLTGDEIVVYNYDPEDETIGCILVKDPDDTSVIGGDTVNATFVLNVATKMVDEGDTYYEVQGYKDNEKVAYKVDPTTYDYDELEALIGTLVVPQYAVNGKVSGFHVADSGVFGPDADRSIVYAGDIDSITNSGKLVIDGDELAIKASANVYVFNALKAESGRGFYEIDAGADYLDYTAAKGVFFDDGENAGEHDLVVAVYVFYTKDTKTTDVVYYIYDIDED